MPTLPLQLRRGPAGQKKASLYDIDGLRWTFLHAPPEIEHIDLHLDYAVVDRPANHPLVEEHARGLARMRLTWLLGYPDFRRSVESRLSDLKGLCRNGKLLGFDYGPAESGWWRCVDLSWRTRARNLDQETTRAEVQLELVRAIDPKVGALVSFVRPVAS